MEARRAVAVGMILTFARAGDAWAQGAEASSTAAFPDTAPQPNANASSQAGFPSPGSSPARAPTSPPAYQYQQYAPSPQWPQYSAPANAAPPGGYAVPAYQPAWSTGAYGAGPTNYEPPPDKANEAKDKPVRYASLTLSPVHLALPVFEATLEVRPTEHLGIAVVGGLGDAPPAVVGQTLVEGEDRFAVREIGGQVLIYPFSNFDGFVVGGELLSVKVSGSATIRDQAVDVTGSALALGPLIGGKWIHESGFTLFGHLGVQRLWLKAESTAAGHVVTADDSRWFPLLNLNAGWSF